MAVTLSGSWTQLASYEIWNKNNMCYMYFQVFAYCTQDTTNKRSTIHTRARIYIVNKNTGYSGYSVTQTWASGLTGASDTSWYGTIKDAGAGAVSEYVLSDGSFTVNHDSNGNASSKVCYWFQGSVTGRIDNSSAGVEVTLPKINVKPAAGKAGTITVSNITYNGAKFSWSGFTLGSGASLSKYQYSWNNSTWTDYGSNTSLTASNKNPNTSYTLYVRAIDNYGTASAVASKSFTTSKPAAGNASTIKYSISATINSVKISISGGTPGAGGSISYYRIKWDGASSFSRVSNPVTYIGLSANTSYSFNIDFVDNYGTASSNNVSGTTTTILPDAPIKGVVSVNNITDNSAIVSWIGFEFDQNSTWGKYQYKINNGLWIDHLTDQSLILKDLSPSTSYTIYVRLVNNYGTASESDSITFTTKEKNKWNFGRVFIKSNNEWKYGNVYFKDEDTWIKPKGFFIKNK